MRELFRKLILFCLVFLITISPAFSKSNKIKMLSHINQDFRVADFPDEVRFKTIKKIKIFDDIVIPQRSIITVQTVQAQKERRWHKSGYIICKVKNFITEYENNVVDISDKNLYLVARKYEPIDKKEASILATEIVLTQAASFFAPGVDILYFFTKGAIQREKHPNWFKAGVYNAYENSICWFWLKGKPIDLEENDKVTLKEIGEEKALKLKGQIEKRKEKQAVRDEDKRINKEFKQLKADVKSQLKNLPENDYNILFLEIEAQTIADDTKMAF